MLGCIVQQISTNLVQTPHERPTRKNRNLQRLKRSTFSFASTLYPLLNIQINKQTCRQKNRQTKKQTNKQTHLQLHKHAFSLPRKPQALLARPSRIKHKRTPLQHSIGLDRRLAVQVEARNASLIVCRFRKMIKKASCVSVQLSWLYRPRFADQKVHPRCGKSIRPDLCVCHGQALLAIPPQV